MQENDKTSKRAPYSKPTLDKHGRLAEVTEGQGTGLTPGGVGTGDNIKVE
jgi:hypothetical protein